jgi:hypothetical protein
MARTEGASFGLWMAQKRAPTAIFALGACPARLAQSPPCVVRLATFARARFLANLQFLMKERAQQRSSPIDPRSAG